MRGQEAQDFLIRMNIEIDDGLMAEAQKVSGHATKKQTVEEALRLMVRLRRQGRAATATVAHRRAQRKGQWL
jgi:Arc/MetJ family transcription regulator